MAAQECVICGGAVPDSAPERCSARDRAHLLAGRAPRAERRPPEYMPGDHAALLYDSDERCLSACRVELISPVEQYGDAFSADRTYDAWSKLVAATDGILRGFGGLDELTACAVDPAEWGRYERSIGDLLEEEEALGLCLYDARYCPAELLETAAGHPLIGTRDKIHVCA